MSNVTPFDRTPEPEDEEEFRVEPQPWEVRNESCETCPITHLCCTGKDTKTFPHDEWCARNEEMNRLIAAHGIPAGCPNPC